MFRLFNRKPKEETACIRVAKWLDDILMKELPDNTEAFCFNLYEDGENNWSMELVATDQFDLQNEDWACCEVASFGSRENPYVWKQEAEWDAVLEEMTQIIKEYLSKGKYAKKLLSGKGIGIGFADGDLSILHSK